MVAVARPVDAERHTRAWLAQWVAGMDLCPFARPLLDVPALRLTVCPHTAAAQLRQALLAELDLLQRSPESEVATTLLVFSHALEDFDTYLDFLEEAQALLAEAGLEGVLQMASFHPRYQFAGEEPGGASHYSNRSPWPTVHILREAMLTRVLESHPEPARIPRDNVARLEGLGTEALARRWQELFSAPG